MELKNIAIAGATGPVGRAILTAFQESEAEFIITALIRTTSAKPIPENVNKIITVDFGDSDALTSALGGQDAILVCVPPAALTIPAQKLMIDSAIAAGIKLYFADEFVANIMNSGFQIFPGGIVGEKIWVRKYLEEKATSGEIAFTALNGGPFFDMWLMKGPAGFDIANKKAKIYNNGIAKLCWTPLPIIAETVIKMLLNPEKIQNRAIFICGVEKGLTQLSLLEALEAETGGSKFDIEHVDLNPIKEESLQLLAKGESRLAMRGLTLNSVFHNTESRGDIWHLVENDLLDVKPVTIREAVRQCLEDCKAE